MHFIKAFIRNFNNNRLYIAINITGLAIGLTAFAFILLYILDETSYDKHHTNYKNIYRLESDITISGKQQSVAKTSYALGPALQREIPEIDDFTRFRGIENCYFQVVDKKFYEEDIYYCDSAVFRIFTHKFIHGNPKTALKEPYSLVLTESLALKYFGQLDVVNKLVNVKNKFTCKITAVVEDLPPNTHLKFTGLISMPSIQTELGEKMYADLNNIHYWAIRLFTYIKIRDGESIDVVYDHFRSIHDKHIAPVSKKMNGVYRLNTTRLDKIHLYNTHDWDLPKGNANTVYVMYAIAFLILLIAGINYMNLATARSVQKAREVGMRKVLGAHRSQLSRFYMLDALLLSFIALIISLVLLEFLLPYFNQITHKTLSFELGQNGLVLLGLFIASMCIGFLSGLYPAYYLSSFQPTGIFAKVQPLGATSGLLRKGLIIFQFSIAVAMIAASLVITFQVDYIKNHDLGFDRENLLVIRATDTTFKKQVNVFNEEILQLPEVLGASTSNTLPGTGNYLDIFLVESKSGMDKQLISLMHVGENLIDVLGLNLVEGRNFLPNSESDRLQAVIINRSAEKKLGWMGEAIGKKVIRRGYDRENFVVIGLIDDLVFTSLYEHIGPIFIFLEESPQDLLCIRISENNQAETISSLDRIWSEHNQNEPFEYNFLSDLIEEMYVNEFNLNKVILAFALLALFISLLGLYGLTSFITEKSSKDIGIRKLLGAKVTGIVLQLMQRFSMLIIIALLIAIPVSWYTLDNWLDHFAYRINLRFSWFVASGFIVLLVAQISVISLTLKAALTNPAEAIRYE